MCCSQFKCVFLEKTGGLLTLATSFQDFQRGHIQHLPWRTTPGLLFLLHAAIAVCIALPWRVSLSSPHTLAVGLLLRVGGLGLPRAVSPGWNANSPLGLWLSGFAVCFAGGMGRGWDAETRSSAWHQGMGRDGTASWSLCSPAYPSPVLQPTFTPIPSSFSSLTAHWSVEQAGPLRLC